MHNNVDASMRKFQFFFFFKCVGEIKFMSTTHFVHKIKLLFMCGPLSYVFIFELLIQHLFKCHMMM